MREIERGCLVSSSGYEESRGEECSRVLMETMGDNWQHVDMGHGVTAWQINEQDVQAVSAGGEGGVQRERERLLRAEDSRTRWR